MKLDLQILAAQLVAFVSGIAVGIVIAVNIFVYNRGL